MKRKSILLGLALVALLAGLASAAVFLLRCEPRFYRAAEQPAGEARRQRSAEFSNDSMGLVNDILNDFIEIGNPGRSAWQWPFTAEQINSYFSEDFVRSGLAEKILPKNLREPRVAIDQDRLRLGFRYGHGACAT